MGIIPIQIRLHLIPFLIKELNGEAIFIENKNVKICTINNASTLGFLFKLILNEEDFNTYAQFKFFFKLDKQNISYSKGMVYLRVKENKFRCWRVVPEKAKKINDILEDIFRISFSYYLKGYLEKNDNIHEAINDFMLLYELDEYNIEVDQLRKIYLRNSEYPLERLQTPTTKVKNA
jgi:hypothetical protein